MRLRNIPGAKDATANSPYVVKEPQKQKGSWKKIFGDEKPIHIEVGMGKGRFLMDMARQNPDINYIGIEMYDSVLLRALQKLQEYEAGGGELKNLCFICIDARLLPDIFDRGEVEKIYLNFSDPWPKARHAKRRLTSEQFLNRYCQILPEGGMVEFKTDNRTLFEFSLEEIPKAGWTLISSTFDLHHDSELCKGNVMTEYEEKFSSMGNPICKLIAKC